MIRGVIFDMDGVLVDNSPVHEKAYVELCKRYGIDIKGQKLDWMYGLGNDQIIPRLMPSEMIDRKGLDGLSHEKELIYRDLIEKEIEPTKGLIGFLDQIRARGLKTAVGSSGPKVNVDFVLDKCSIADKFDAVANGDMVDERKPDPAVFILAAELLGLEPEECLVIEDSEAGIEAANRAGTAVVAMQTSLPLETLRRTRNDMIIRDFTEIDYEKVISLGK